MPQSYFPLRWESTGDQWWYASPIDWAAANGHYDLVRELLYLDTNLLIKLTSLRRIRRLETVWDDDYRFIDAAKGRSFVARNLLLECETKNHKNSLIRAGYGGWLLYTAASAGDVAFVKELLERDPLLVFGEGEYGVTDILYASARSKNSEVFRLLFEYAARPKCLVGGGGGEIEEEGVSRGGNLSVFRSEMVNRAVHAAARGGNLEMLSELLHGDCADVLAYRDVQGSTILHSASGRGQVEVVKYLVSSSNIINSRDNQGNIALHIAAFRGHLSIAEALIIASPTSSSTTNNAGDTFLHMAVAGFRTPGFRRLDRQMELMKNLINGSIIDIQEIINIRNNEGKTVMHVSVIGNMHSDLVELLMTVRSIDLNILDINGMTPLDLLSQRPRSASSEILIKKLVSVGGIFSARDRTTIPSIAAQPRMQGIGTSPGSSFKISDAKIFLYTGIEVSEVSGRPSSCSSSAKSEVEFSSEKKLVQNSVNKATSKLKILLRWPRRKEKKKLVVDDELSMESIKKWSEHVNTPTPLRHRFSKTSLLNNKRTLSVRNSMPSPASKKKFAAGLMHGVIQAMPHLAPPSARSQSDSFSKSGMSTPAKSEKQKEGLMHGVIQALPHLAPPSARSQSDSFSKSGMSTPAKSEKQKEICLDEEEEIETVSCSNSTVNVGAVVGEKFSHRLSFVNSKLMNQYFCFGAQGLAVEDSVSGQRSGRMFKRSALSVA